MTRADLREWLDRKPPDQSPAKVRWWVKWFEGAEYLGERSARVGPDAVNSAQRCECAQCVGVADATELHVVCQACRTK